MKDSAHTTDAGIPAVPAKGPRKQRDPRARRGPAEQAPAARAWVEEARRVFGDRLAGVLLFGSYARGDSRDTSDIDLLIVLDSGIPLRRELYRRWDQDADVEEKVSPHLVHVPAEPDQAGSLWLETALDSRILYDRSGAVADLLAQLRKLVETGGVERRMVHGHPYWIRHKREIAGAQ